MTDFTPLCPVKLANFFIIKAVDYGCVMTSLKLNKLVYISHGWCLGLTGLPLINEPIIAKEFGPIIESLYYAFREYGAMRILSPLWNYGFPSAYYDEFLQSVWDNYKDLSGLELSTLTHRKGSPWERANAIGQKIIPNEKIEKYYKGLMEAKEND